MPRNLLTLGTSAAAFLGVWYLLGQAGYRAGNRVMVGPTALDPELLRGLFAALAAFLSATFTKQPWFDTVRSVLTQLGLVPALSNTEQRDLYDRVVRIDETVTPKN